MAEARPVSYREVREGLRNVILVVGVLMGATILAGTAIYVLHEFNKSTGNIITGDVNLLGRALPFLSIVGIIAGVAVLLGMLWPVIHGMIGSRE